jgi:hypothetical protein
MLFALVKDADDDLDSNDYGEESKPRLQMKTKKNAIFRTSSSRNTDF